MYNYVYFMLYHMYIVHTYVYYMYIYVYHSYIYAYPKYISMYIIHIDLLDLEELAIYPPSAGFPSRSGGVAPSAPPLGAFGTPVGEPAAAI